MVKNLVHQASKRNIVNLKIYFDRARMYLGYINFFLLNLVLISSFDGSVGAFIQSYKLIIIPALIVFYVLTLLLIGYLDTKFGVRQEEMRNNAMNNPIIMDIVESLDQIKKDVKEISEKIR